MSAGLDRKIYAFFKKREIDYLQLTGRSVVVGAETVEVLQYDSASKILLCRGTTIPTNATAGYAKGAIFIKTDAGAGVTGFYTNKGTIASSAFGAETAATIPGDITLTTNSMIVGVGGLGAELAIAVQSIPGRAAGALANLAIAEARVLGRATGGSLGAVQITNEHVDAAAALALSKLATQAANTILVNATAGVAVPTAVAVSAQSVLLRAAGNLIDTAIAENRVLGRVTGGNLGAVLVTGSMVDPNAAFALTQLATQAANTVLVNATAGAAVPTALALGAQSVLIRAAGNIEALTVAANRVVGRLTGGNVAAIQITTAEIDAAAAIALTQLAAQAALTINMNATNAAASPTAVALAANQIFRVSAAPVIEAYSLARKAVLGASATILTGYALARGDLLSASAADLVAITPAAGSVVCRDATDILGVALATGSILIGASGVAPVALDIAVNEVLYRVAAGTLDGLALPAGSLLTGGATQLEAAAIAAGEVVVGATGPVIDGVALATGSILIGATGTTPVALDLAVNEVLYRIAAGTLDGLALSRLQLLKGGAANLAALSIAAGDIVTANATDVAVVAIAAGEVVVGAAGPAIDGVALATNTLLTGATGTTPVALLVNEGRVVGRATGGVLDDVQIVNEHVGAAAAIAASKLALTGSIGAVQHAVLTKTVEATNDNITVLAATLLQGYLEKTSCTVSGKTLTFDTAANIQAAFNTTSGAWFKWLFSNISTQVITLTAAAGLTLKGTVAVPDGKTAIVTFVNTGADAIDVVITLAA